MQPRSAAAAGSDFPYTSRTTCYIEISDDGTVSHGTDAGTYERARSGKSRLFAVWPGNWSSDLFIIDDLDEYARAHGIIHDQARTGLDDHEHQVRWKLSPYETKPNGSYISIELELDCDCTIEDLKTFAGQMRHQRGWDIATSGGWGRSSGQGHTTYSLRVRRKSLT
ncbi:hypothetical protein OG401_06320 [Kitasatospora purpeofusca]|uniref:hypothetical protein n=1 Tax=Kitasatospora purpeofusca TaxID=67352 RepID=UPI0022532C74|nr:hypothetical protein [Kitasatospora purpeofusca]MCX4683930.1 hypothetical protein [Kitasatospora purpeofusca]